MIKHLFNLACSSKKDRRKLTANGESSSPSSSGENIDDTLDQSVVIPIKGESEEVNTSPLMSKVIGDVSFDTALLQNRETPIDFCTKEVRTDDDIRSTVSGNRNSNFVTPSPIPEETEEFLSSIERDRIFEPSNSSFSPPIIRAIKATKRAEVYNIDESSPSASSSSNNDDSRRIDTIRARMSKSMSTAKMNKARLTPILGGSLRPQRTKRHSVAFDGNSKFYALDGSRLIRLRKRGDASRRDAVEAGFEPRDAVPRCHSTQSLREVQRVKAYSNSQFQASDLSLDPNGRVLAACDSTSGTAIAPATAVVNPAQTNRSQHHQVNHRNHHQHHQNLSYDGQLHHEMVDRRRSLQALTGASSLYQMANGAAGGRSQFSPSELGSSNAQIHHHVGSRVRVASVNQLCDSTSTPQFSIDQRRSVHNIGGTNNVRNSFAEGIKTTSTPKNQIAVAPLAHKSRHLSESRDEMRSERRGSAGNGQINLPAYQKYLMTHSGEERLVDGPVTNANEARIAYLEKRIRELEMKETHSMQSTPNQSRHSKSSHYVNGNLSTTEQLRLQEMQDELMGKERKVASLESKLLKAYQRIERLNEDHEGKIKGLLYDGERARDDLTRCVDKIHQLEDELAATRAVAQSGDQANEQEYHELRDKIWKQERELQENRTILARLREKEAEFERMRSEKGYLELKNENLNKKLEAKKRTVEELERSVSTLRLEQTICQQSCSSGSTPLADEMETMSDIRPSMARPYTKAHSTMGSHMSPLSHSKSSGLTKSFSNFALNSSKRDDVTPMMSRTIREQNRHITMCRAMVVCLKDTVDRMARGENPDVARLLGVKLNVMSESELDEDDNEDYEADESKPFSMMTAESALTKQCAKLSELDKDLDTIRCQLADWHGQTNSEGDGDREVCRVQ